MVIEDIRAGNGVCFADPHGDTAEKLLKAIPTNRINDVIYFNPADTDYPIAFNPMEYVGEEKRFLVCSQLMMVFYKIWKESWGPQLEHILRHTLLAIMENQPSTLLGVQRMLTDERYRDRVVRNIKDPIVSKFWNVEFKQNILKRRDDPVSSTLNKIGQFLTVFLIRNILGQPKSSFDLREVMDSRKILIVNLSKGKLGEDNSSLLGAMLITKIYLAAMSRVNIPEDDRKDFYLYVDEFQNFATESFCNILSESRKYRLSLILANQYIEQIDEDVRASIFGNCGTLISFRVGAKDAEEFEKELPPFLQEDFINLPNYHCYLRLMIDGFAGQAFSAVGLPPKSLAETEANEEKIIKNSRQRYCKSRSVVEQNILKWSQ
jgi:type IV secretory pathway TraG/TraD family ATPase VirD4